MADDLKARITANEKMFSKADALAAVRKVGPLAVPIMLDDRYWAVDRATWDAMIEAYGPDRNAYVKERYDCDDFAFAFKGGMGHRYEVNGVGIVINYAQHHAYNILLVNEGGSLVAEFLEPQQDRFVRTPMPTLYTLTTGLIVI